MIYFCVGNHLLLISQADFSNNNEEILFYFLLHLAIFIVTVIIADTQ